jgi:hypothetical protein
MKCRAFGDSGLGPRHHWHGHPHGHLFGLDTEKMGPRAQVVTSLAVLAPVALSGVFLVAVVPSLWWIFTTYFWVAFPALGLLTSGISGLGEDMPVRISEEERERELLEAIRESGEISAAAAAARTSLTVAEANRRLQELAENGHLEVRARGGAIFYALWGVDEGVSRSVTEGN